MSKLILVGLAFAVATTTAVLEDSCLACMCYVSSSGCKMRDPVCVDSGWGADVCGPWAITKFYHIEGGYQGGDFYICTADWACNESTVRLFLDRFVTDPDADCEIYARTHVGGPNGENSDFTLDYWYQVRDCLDNVLITPPSSSLG